MNNFLTEVIPGEYFDLTSEEGFVHSLWDTVTIPQNVDDNLADYLLEDLSTGLDYRMETQNIYTSNGQEMYGLIYRFLILADKIVQKKPDDLGELNEFIATEKNRLIIIKK